MTGTATAGKPAYDANVVGWMFVQEYYTFLNKDPARLHCFYNKKSTFVHSHEGDQGKTCHGPQEIHERIMELGFKNCRVLVSNVDTQASLNGGIVVQVLGELSNNGSPSHKFSQTFFLAEQPNGYYVLNDIFRFLKEDIYNHNEENINADGEKVVQEQFVNADAKHQATAANKAVGFTEPWASAPAPAAKAVEAPKSQPVAAPAKAEATNKAVEPPKKAPASPVKEQKPVTPKVAPKPVAQTAPQPVEQAAPKPVTAPVAAPKENAAVDRPASTKPAAAAPRKAPEAPKPAEKPVEKPVEQTPAKPKTWANLAATNVDKFANELSPAKGQVMNNVPATTKSPSKPAKTNNNNRAQSAAPATKKPVDEALKADDDFKTVVNKKTEGKRQDSNRPQTQGDDKERFSIYLKGLPANTTEKMIEEVFSKVGNVRNVDILPNRNISFVEFDSVEAANKAIGSTFVINGASLLAEERRKNRSFVPAQGSKPQNKNKKDFPKGKGRPFSSKKDAPRPAQE